MKNIIVPTDFSSSARNAAEFALSLAQLTDSKVTFLHVIQLIADPVMATALPVTTLEDAQREMENFKSSIQLSDKSDVNSISETKIVYGEVSPLILETAIEIKADFIVMGHVGHSNFFGTIFGSQTLNIIKGAKCPVWVIPDKIALSTIKSVIYAADLEGDEIEVINKLITVADLLGAKLKAVHIEEELEPEVFSSEEIIAGIKKHLTNKSIVFKNLHREDTIIGIDTYIRNQKPDLIVVAQEKRGFFENLFHSSVIRHFIFSAKTPMLVLHKRMEIDE
jgi:nucleotide-binding universal stress UspA family protein